MREIYEADVSQVIYAGPHSVQPDTYEIEVKVEPSPGAPWEYIALRFKSSEATFLAHMLQSNQPRAPVDHHLLDQVASHET